MADNGNNNGNNILLQDWKQARDVLKSFDERVHDLRKYGFTFVTGLMAVEGILLPWKPGTAALAPSGLPDDAKLAVMVATLLLIIVLRWFEGSYQGILYGAALRARVVERFLNLELSDEIAVRFAIERLWLPRIILYAGFEGAVLWLAYALLPGHFLYWIAPLIIGAASESALYYTKASPQKLRGRFGEIDWALDRLECRPGDRIRIMVTNFMTKDLTWPPVGQPIPIQFPVAWRILDSDSVQRYAQRVDANLKVEPSFSYVWSFRVPMNWQPGIYRIVANMNIPKQKERELARKLYVLDVALTAGSVATFAGNGVQTAFNIPHGLAMTPTSWSVTPGSAAAASPFYTAATDNTNIVVTFTNPPANGADIRLIWKAVK